MMHGRIYTVESGIALRDSVIEAETPEAVKDVFGWRTEKEVADIVGVSYETTMKGKSFAEISAVSLNQSQLDNLQAQGLHLPEYHFKCRCGIEPV